MTYSSGGCGTTPAVVCPTNLFNPSAIIVGGTIDCLGDATFAPARITACATEAETNRCDTAEIALVICSASGANANPFIAFCTSATNIDGSNIADIRQTALSACFDGMSDDDNGVCQNTMGIRAMLATDCLGARAFETRCDYTEYAPQKTMFCNAQANAWNMLCDGETIGTTAASRDAACLANARADAGHTGSDTPCGMRTNVIAACPVENPFAHVGCDNIAGINTGFRATYCALRDNFFKSVCKNGTHGRVFDRRRDVCLEFGTGMGGDTSCDSNTQTEDECAKNPFDDTNPGCQSILKIEMIVKTYCEETKPSDPNCGVKTSSWVRSFGEDKEPPATLTATTPATERQREFL
ncbi:MAG: hypothetical protein K8953_08755, partial [Proteobacteria bacterium]|nr:hypothetical protein [Pseudomonadota bacterium]